eukprot:107421-Chlamydomonas_euryale.AAC.13
MPCTPVHTEGMRLWLSCVLGTQDAGGCSYSEGDSTGGRWDGLGGGWDKSPDVLEEAFNTLLDAQQGALEMQQQALMEAEQRKRAVHSGCCGIQ